jgi:hypothetical protein
VAPWQGGPNRKLGGPNHFPKLMHLLHHHVTSHNSLHLAQRLAMASYFESSLSLVPMESLQVLWCLTMSGSGKLILTLRGPPPAPHPILSFLFFFKSAAP